MPAKARSPPLVCQYHIPAVPAAFCRSRPRPTTSIANPGLVVPMPTFPPAFRKSRPSSTPVSAKFSPGLPPNFWLMCHFTSPAPFWKLMSSSAVPCALIVSGRSGFLFQSVPIPTNPVPPSMANRRLYACAFFGEVHTSNRPPPAPSSISSVTDGCVRPGHIQSVLASLWTLLYVRLLQPFPPPPPRDSLFCRI